jgi:hypothetical protein
MAPVVVIRPILLLRYAVNAAIRSARGALLVCVICGCSISRTGSGRPHRRRRNPRALEKPLCHARWVTWHQRVMYRVPDTINWIYTSSFRGPALLLARLFW